MTGRSKPIWKQVLGILSHLFTFLVVLMAMIVIWRGSRVYALLYLLIFAGWYVTIFLAYCASCPCHRNCTHVYMGWLAARLFRTWRPKPSSALYIVNTGLLIVLLIYPLYWLKDRLLLLAGFWLVMIALGPLITPLYCPQCENRDCPVHRLTSKE